MSNKTYVDENGYRRFLDSDKLVHRYVAEKKIRRSLRKGEVVHHIDRNKLNNSARNLWVFKNQEAHHRAHEIDAKKHGKKVSYRGFEKDENSGCLLGLFISLISTLFILSKIIL
jgi:hypothetical protein